jgi:hypothetical protein
MKSFLLFLIYIFYVNFKFTIFCSNNINKKISNFKEDDKNLKDLNLTRTKNLKKLIKRTNKKSDFKENLNPMESSPIWKSVLTPQIETTYFSTQP